MKDSWDVNELYTLRLEDVGTRFDHLTDLLDIWNVGYNIIAGKAEEYQTEREKDMLKTLVFAIELLKKHMTGIGSKYDETLYQSVINTLPKDATEIKDNNG